MNAEVIRELFKNLLMFKLIVHEYDFDFNPLEKRGSSSVFFIWI